MAVSAPWRPTLHAITSERDLVPLSIDQILGWADQLILAQKQNAQTMERISESSLPVVNLVRGSLKAAVAGSAMSPAGD